MITPRPKFCPVKGSVFRSFPWVENLCPADLPSARYSSFDLHNVPVGDLALHTSANEWADQLKAAAIAYRRARRPTWQNAHADRLAREREARRVAKEYRQARREAGQAAEPHKRCTCCYQSLPLSAYGLKKGKPRAHCRACDAEKKRASRQTVLELTDEQRDKRNADARAYYHRRQGRTSTGSPRGSISPERRREVAERILHLTELLMGSSPRQRISDQQTWEATASELHRLWLQLGDKQCVSCKATVPPSRILPPGPANFYPGKCRPCAEAEWRENSRRVTGREPAGPRLIPMKDGTAITIAELARRHRERSRAYRLGQSRSVFEQKSEAG